jgi:hypothetical protein
MSTKLPGLRAQMSLSAVAASAPQQFRLFDRHALPAVPAEPKRRRIWELSGNFHCSIIGTCLTTSELRHVLIKMQLPGAEKESDHELHGRAVLLAQKRDQASKQLQKALDRRHRLIVNQFNKARTTDELRTLWAAAVQRAEIPGAYWAVLTHPQVSEDLARHAFGEVHMLSHLVGAANRADIRRLRDLEGENAALQEKLARQQKQLRDAVVIRDATIANLNEALGKAIVSARQDDSTPSFPADDAERDATVHLVGNLRRRLALEAAGRERLGKRVHQLVAELDMERKQRLVAEQRQRDLQEEIDVAELSFATPPAEREREGDQAVDLGGLTLLYVGGRAHNLPQLRMLAERSSAVFLHHDGGIGDRAGLLESHLSTADIVFFPVDCVSHNAVAVVKRVARHLGKRYLPLRSSGLTSFVMALRREAVSLHDTGRQTLEETG